MLFYMFLFTVILKTRQSVGEFSVCTFYLTLGVKLHFGEAVRPLPGKKHLKDNALEVSKKRILAVQPISEISTNKGKQEYHGNW